MAPSPALSACCCCGVPAEGNKVPCVNNTQTWVGYLYPGIITTHPTGTEDYSIRGKFKGARTGGPAPGALLPLSLPHGKACTLTLRQSLPLWIGRSLRGVSNSFQG